MTMMNMNAMSCLKIVILLHQLLGGMSQFGPPTGTKAPTVSAKPSLRPSVSFNPTISSAPSDIPSVSQNPSVSLSPSTIYGISRGSCYTGFGNVVCDQSESMCADLGTELGYQTYWYVPGYIGRSGCCHCKASCATEDLKFDQCSFFYDDTDAPTSEPSTVALDMVEDQPCFSALTTAFVQGKGSITMDLLEVGDSVLTGSGEFQSVYSIDHRDFNKITTFLQIMVGGNNNVLEVTPNHMIFKEGNEIPVPSATIKVGDRVVTPSGFEKIIDITMVERKGVFNPLTTDGTIVASGIVASTFSSLINQNEYIEIAGSSIMSYQEFFTNLLKPYKFICTAITLDLCRADKEKVMVSELASRVFFYHNGDSVYQASLLSTVAFMISVMQKIVVPLLYVSVPFGIYKFTIAGKK